MGRPRRPKFGLTGGISLELDATGTKVGRISVLLCWGRVRGVADVPSCTPTTEVPTEVPTEVVMWLSGVDAGPMGEVACPRGAEGRVWEGFLGRCWGDGGIG